MRFLIGFILYLLPLCLFPLGKNYFPGQTKVFQNITFVYIPSGTFLMGSLPREKGRDIDERKKESVQISSGFYLSETEITQKQWNTHMNVNPSHFIGEARPVDSVSYDLVLKFIDVLNDKQKVSIFTLPTEDEWEYACRAGTDSIWFFGNEMEKISEYSWYAENSEEKTQLVKQKKPNPWGLYDIYGNVYEWCLTEEGTGVSSYKKEKVFRGGAWYNFPLDMRSSSRNYNSPDSFHFGNGFRLKVFLDQSEK